MRQIHRNADGSSSWLCDCGQPVVRSRGESDVQCPECGAWYNASAQRLRDDWQGNPSNYDDEIGDLEGFEIQQLRQEMFNGE